MLKKYESGINIYKIPAGDLVNFFKFTPDIILTGISHLPQYEIIGQVGKVQLYYSLTVFLNGNHHSIKPTQESRLLH
jgi:hypothetical protein